MIQQENHNDDGVYSQSIRAGEEIGSSAAKSGHAIGILLAQMTLGVAWVILKFEALFVRRLRCWAAHLYDKLGFKIMF